MMRTSTEPVVVGGAAAAVSAAVAALLAAVGFSAEDAGQWASAAGAVVSAAVTVWAIVRTRARVTPLAAPRDAVGVPLAPMLQVWSATAASSAQQTFTTQSWSTSEVSGIADASGVRSDDPADRRSVLGLPPEPWEDGTAADL
jgi:hypothetical protein